MIKKLLLAIYHMSRSGRRGGPERPTRDFSVDAKTVDRLSRNISGGLAAEMDSQCPEVDLHGKTRDDVGIEIDRLIETNVGEDAVRIIYGGGTGVLETAVIVYLKQLQREKKIKGFKVGSGGVSCVVTLLK